MPWIDSSKAYVGAGKKMLWNKKYSRAMNFACKHSSSFIQTVTVGFGITPNHALRLVGCTTGRELHPALKIVLN